MITLPHPVTLTLAGLGEKTFTELPVTTIDINSRKRVQVLLRPFMRELVIWSGDEYDAVGDYTQAQVESRVLELLGDNPEQVLLSLYIPLHS